MPSVHCNLACSKIYPYSSSSNCETSPHFGYNFRVQKYTLLNQTSFPDPCICTDFKCHGEAVMFRLGKWDMEVILRGILYYKKGSIKQILQSLLNKGAFAFLFALSHCPSIVPLTLHLGMTYVNLCASQASVYSVSYIRLTTCMIPSLSVALEVHSMQGKSVCFQRENIKIDRGNPLVTPHSWLLFDSLVIFQQYPIVCLKTRF